MPKNSWILSWLRISRENKTKEGGGSVPPAEVAKRVVEGLATRKNSTCEPQRQIYDSSLVTGSRWMV